VVHARPERRVAIVHRVSEHVLRARALGRAVAVELLPRRAARARRVRAARAGRRRAARRGRCRGARPTPRAALRSSFGRLRTREPIAMGRHRRLLFQPPWSACGQSQLADARLQSSNE